MHWIYNFNIATPGQFFQCQADILQRLAEIFPPVRRDQD
jgi:hypothetical protein